MSYRFPARLDLRVTARGKDSDSARIAASGFARNLNRSGLSLTTDSSIELGTILTLELQLPNKLVRAEGEVVRHTRYEQNKAPRIANGVRFTRIDPQDQDEISKFLFWQIAPRESSALHLTTLSQRED